MCREWRRALGMTVTALHVGPMAREALPHYWNRQQLMMQRLPALFPCLRSLDFNQARPASVGSGPWPGACPAPGPSCSACPRSPSACAASAPDHARPQGHVMV